MSASVEGWFAAFVVAVGLRLVAIAGLPGEAVWHETAVMASVIADAAMKLRPKIAILIMDFLIMLFLQLFPQWLS